MRVATGRVVAGKVVVEGEPLPDGAEVLVVIDDTAEAPFHLVPEEEAELLESIREADAGLGVDAWQFLRDLAREKT